MNSWILSAGLRIRRNKIDKNMDREQLYKNLTELEKQLQKVKSANEQVDRIIASDRKLADGIKEYIVKADDLLKTVKSAYDSAVSKVNEQANIAVKETTEGLLNKYKSEVATARSEYNASMKESVDSFKNVVDAEKKALQTKVASLSQLVDEKLIPLRDSLSSIVEGKMAQVPEEFKGIINEGKSILDSSASALKTASEVVSKACHVMAEKVTVLPRKVEGFTEEVSKALSLNRERILAKLSEIDVNAFAEKVSATINEQTTHLDVKLDDMGKSVSEMERTLSGSVSKLDSKVKGMEKKLATMQEKIDGMDKILRFVKTASILLIVLAAVLLILRFI